MLPKHGSMARLSFLLGGVTQVFVTSLGLFGGKTNYGNEDEVPVYSGRPEIKGSTVNAKPEGFDLVPIGKLIRLDFTVLPSADEFVPLLIGTRKTIACEKHAEDLGLIIEGTLRGRNQLQGRLVRTLDETI